MAKSLQEYIEWLDGRDIIWPQPPDQEKPKATPFVKPLPGIRGVTWNLYGTLLHVADGRLLFEHPQQLRMQVALEKTIAEFNMWQSMSRQPGAPWEYMLQQYTGILEDQRLTGAKRKGDFPEINSAKIWKKLIERLQQNEYEWDEDFYGDLDDLSEKVAYFFHASLQGVQAAPDAVATLQTVAAAGMTQGLLCDAQPFSLAQTLRAFKQQAQLPPLNQLFNPSCLTLSYQQGVRQPSKSLYETAIERFEEEGVGADEIVHIGSRLADDLAVAKQLGMRTVLYAGDKSSLEATSKQVADPKMKPNRLITDLKQIRDIRT